MKEELLKLIAAHAETQGCELYQAVRDCLSDIRHICHEHDVDFTYASETSNEVFEEELSQQQDAN